MRDGTSTRRPSRGGPRCEFLAAGGGFRYVAVQSDDLAADVAAMRARGVDVSAPADGARRTPAGQELRWKAATLGPEIRCRSSSSSTSHRWPSGARWRGRQASQRGAARGSRLHRGGGCRARGRDLQPACSGCRCRRSSAERHQGGHGGVRSRADRPDRGAARRARPCRRGARPARARAVPGAVSHTQHGRRRALDGGHGVPPPARGIRNTGEQAMLVGPQERAAPTSASWTRRRGSGGVAPWRH